MKMNITKILQMLGMMVVTVGVYPSFVSADVIPFSRHCEKNIELNDFALIQSRPTARGTPLVPADNGGWVAIYEVPEIPDSEDPEVPAKVDPIPLTIEGTANHDREFVSICSNDKIVAIIPTYFENATDDNRKFSFSFEIGFEIITEADGVHQTLSAVLQNPKFHDGEDLIDLNECTVDINDSKLEYQKILMPDGTLNSDVSDRVRCLAPDGSQLLGGLAYHEIYASVQREDRGGAQETTAFGIENYDRVTTFNYAIFPPLEELSGCNGSSIAKLSVEDMRCLPMDRQVEFKRYFLGLPEVIQKLFDFDSDTEDEAAEAVSTPLLVNYFNEIIPTDEKEYLAHPENGEWLNISSTAGKYRYMKNFTELPKDDELKGGLISYYDETEAECGSEDTDPGCWDAKYKGEDEYACTIDPATYLSQIDLGTGGTSTPAFPQGCNGGAFPTLSSDQSALLEHVGISDTNHPKVIAISAMNEKANEVCTEVRDAGDDLTMLQALNATGVEITQFMADLDARYEGFGACEKIQAINTMSGMMDRMLEVLGREVAEDPAP